MADGSIMIREVEQNSTLRRFFGECHHLRVAIPHMAILGIRRLMEAIINHRGVIHRHLLRVDTLLRDIWIMAMPHRLPIHLRIGPRVLPLQEMTVYSDIQTDRLQSLLHITLLENAPRRNLRRKNLLETQGHG
jgi:hypothetical protein